MSARKKYPYPEDEFDEVGAADGPQGVHRAERSTGSKVLPWIVVLVLVPLISFGIVFYLSQNDSDFGDVLFGDDDRPGTSEGPRDDAADDEQDSDAGSEGEAPESDEDSAEDDSEGGEADDPSPDDEEAEDEEPAAEVNRAAQVRVLNATRISGLAALGTERVRADGFSEVAADNYTGGTTRANSVVKYLGEEMLPTAQQVAQVLRIDDVVEDPAVGEVIIVELWSALD